MDIQPWTQIRERGYAVRHRLGMYIYPTYLLSPPPLPVDEMQLGTLGSKPATQYVTQRWLYVHVYPSTP